jgi:hypothetical protein
MTFRWMRRARELFERWREVERFGATAGLIGVEERVAFEVIEDERLNTEVNDGR